MTLQTRIRLGLFRGGSWSLGVGCLGWSAEDSLRCTRNLTECDVTIAACHRIIGERHLLCVTVSHWTDTMRNLHISLGSIMGAIALAALSGCGGPDLGGSSSRSAFDSGL